MEETKEVTTCFLSFRSGIMGTINFCHPSFRPTVVSDKVSADNYNVTNLVAVENYMPPKVSTEIRTTLKIQGGLFRE